MRVRIQLPDDEKYWLLVDPVTMKTIKDVIDRINEKFSIICDQLMIDDAQLHWKETIDILQDSDIIRVMVKPINGTKRKANNVDEQMNEMEEAKELLPPPKSKKKSKKDKVNEEEVIQPPNLPEIKEKKKKDKEVPIKKPVTEEPISGGSDATEMTNETTTEEGAKRKRRRRKRKSEKLAEIDDSTFQQPLITYVPLESKERSHIRFDGSESKQPEVKLNGSANLEKLSSNGKWRDADTKFDFSNKPNSPRAASTPKTPAGLGALLSLRATVFSRSPNKKKPCYNNVPPPQIDAPPPAAEVKLDPTKFPMCVGPPRLNDIIAFKVLELSENYNPEVSDYIQGRITHTQNGEITVELLEKRLVKHSRGKFELCEPTDEEEEQEPEEEYETTVTYHWNQMIEPRLIFP